jgi:hypothetical protein
MPISMSDLEARHRQSGDGAESTLWSDDGRDHEDEVEEDEQAGGADATERTRRRKRSRREGASSADPIDAAVFGGGGGAASVAASESEDSHIDNQATRMDRRLQAQRRAFPIRGVHCLGCSVDKDQVAKVDEHVRANMQRLEQTALFKSASLFWHQTVVCPAAAEDVPMPDWDWKSIRSHYQLHVVDANLQRGDCIRQLGAMRKQLELSLLHEDEEGIRTLDPKNADLMLKVMAMQSKEISLLQSSTMPPPSSRPPAAKRC